MNPLADLSKFKKVACDGKTSTLVHSKGHEIRVAHGGLTQKMQARLKVMPLHMKDGGKAAKQDDDIAPQDMPDSSPVEQSPASAQPPSQDDFDQYLDAKNSQPDAVQAPDPTAAAPQQQQQQPMQGPGPALQSFSGVTGIPPVGNDLNSQMAEHASYDQDLAAGNIHPKTYHELYAEKSTLGKIGTLFGLLAGGVGSGLTGQPNMLMEMMNKEIDRDIDKQKTNVANKASFYSAQFNHNLQNAQAQNTQEAAAGQGIANQGKLAGTQSYLNKAYPKGEAPKLNPYYNYFHGQILAPYQAKAKALSTAAHDVGTKVNPRNQNQVATHGALKAAADQGVANTLTRALAASDDANKKIASGQIILPGDMPQSGVNSTAINNDINSEMSTRKNAGQTTSQLPENKTAIDAETAKLDKTLNNAGMWNDAFHKIGNKDLAGQVPGMGFVEGALNSLAGATSSIPLLGSAAAAAVAHGVSESSEDTFERGRKVAIGQLADRTGIPEGKLDRFFPRWIDFNDPERMQEIHDQGDKYFHTEYDEESPTLKGYPQYKRKYPTFLYVPTKQIRHNKKGASGGY